MPQRFVEVQLEGTSTIPLPRAYLNEPFRLYRNRARGFFLKHAPGYPDIPNDLLVRAYHDSQFILQRIMPAGRVFRGYSTRGSNLRSVQMGLAQRQQLIRRRQAQSGYRVTSFAPTSRVSALTPETKYFDCGIAHAVTFTGSDWSASEVPCDNYINSSGAAAAYTDSALIPSAIGSGYGQINGNRYKFKKIRVRGAISVAPLSDQADAASDAVVRLMLVMDTQPNGSQAQGEDIIQDYGATGEVIFGFKRVSNSGGRFRILKDKFYTLKATNSQTDGASTGSIAFDTRFFTFQYSPKVPIQVNVKSGNATPTVAGLETCNIFLLLAGQRDGAAVATTIRAATRCYYVD